MSIEDVLDADITDLVSDCDELSLVVDNLMEDLKWYALSDRYLPSCDYFCAEIRTLSDWP
jgi:hypothetical protein